MTHALSTLRLAKDELGLGRFLAELTVVPIVMAICFATAAFVFDGANELSPPFGLQSTIAGEK